ncbi:MAG: TRAP transporter substrate-binding protein, partial [Proteobacteria bacterium]|nr:TRAP transporter substrate-binding protein [Pseudomonadota bacterium]
MRLRLGVFVFTACLALSFDVAAAKTVVNIGIVTNPTFVHVQAANWFKEDVEKALPGKYEIVVHHSGALGSETQVLQQVQLGTTQMTVCTT